MAVKKILSEKLEELNLVYEGLLKKKDFLSPDNEIFVYHTLDLKKISGTTGSTPKNLSEILSRVTKEINKYVEYISHIPNKQSSIIKRDRGTKAYAIFSEKGQIAAPVTWRELNKGASFYSMQQYLPMSTYRGFVKLLSVKASHTFRKGGENGVDIDSTIIMIKINPRLNILEEYNSFGGSMEVNINSEFLNGDDIFIIGFIPKKKILKTSIYYSDLSYGVDLYGEDDSEQYKTFTIGGTTVGNIIPDVDDTIVNGMIYWNLMTLNEFNIECTTIDGKTYTLLPYTPGNDLGYIFDGNTIKEISVDGMSIDVSKYNISFRNKISQRIVLVDDTYRLYDKMDNGVSKVVFKNVKPIDIVLEEAIDEL